jgi:negative modulator of initiation of replication
MKSIQIDDDLYHFIASQTQHIGESASDILRRLVMPESTDESNPSSNISELVTKEDAANESGVTPVCQAQAVFDELQGQQLQAIPKMVDRWLLVLSILYKHHNQSFVKVLGMSGRNRTYFAKDKDTLLETGSSTNPKNVPGSDYWVITNNNTVKKINMLKGVAREIGFSESDVEHLENVFAPELQEPIQQ